jgi:HTH-type transcriptional regulator, transcriptional repressor of NAD biosynthesis genes
METRKTGLILGKFAPFHFGHQYLLEFAKARVDKLYVLIYEARETTNIPLSTRANWIRQIYPDVAVIAGHDAPTEDDHTERVMKLQDDYIVSMMPEKITHFFSSEWYGEHVSKALWAENVVVDQKREAVKVSATAIRTGKVPSHHFLHPIVNKDVVKKVLFVGAESTGKSTISEQAAVAFNTIWVPEYGRNYWNEFHDADGKLTADQLLGLAQLQRREEDLAFMTANRVVFIDTGAMTTRQYCKDYGHSVPLELDALVQSEKTRYDLVILCNPTIPYHEDGTRRGADVRMETHNKIVADLTIRGIPYYNLVGTNHEDRLAYLRRLLSMTLDIY